MKTWFLTRKKEFLECKVEKTTNHRRVIEILEGKEIGKKKIVHPDGISFGKLYPRIFESEEKPTEFFEFNGRVILKQKEHSLLVPLFDKNYKFQKVLSDIMDCFTARENVLITGERGCGKTTHFEQLCSRLNYPVIRVNLNAETRLSDFIGKYQIVQSENGTPITQWQDGILPTCMKKGYVLILDEIDMCPPEILSLLHPVLEENSILVLKEHNGEVIRPHKEFRIFATANSIGSMQEKAGSYAGTVQMNSAFLDRWHVLEMPNLDFKTEVKVITSKILGIKSKWAKNIVIFANMVRSGKTELGDSFEKSFSTRLCLGWAKKTALLRSPIKGAEITFFSKITPSEKEILKKELEHIFGGVTSRKKRLEQAVPELIVEQALKQEVKQVDTNGIPVATLPVKRKRGRPRKIS